MPSFLPGAIMRKQGKNRRQLLEEISSLKERIAELETSGRSEESTREALKGAEDILLKVFNTIPDLMAFIDRDHRILLSNWHGGYKYVPEELRRGHPFCYEVYYDRKEPCEYCHVDEVFRTGRAVTYEKCNPRIGHVEVRAFPILDDAGNVAMVSENIRDITRRKQDEEALQNNELKLKAIVNGSPIGQFVIDRDHRVVYWNKALEKITGVEASRVIGTDRHSFMFHNEERPSLADLALDVDSEAIDRWYGEGYKKSKLVEGAYEGTGFFPNLGPDGKWLFFTAVSIRGVDGEIVYAMETVEDISESKRAEEEQRRLEEQLAQARKMESVGRLAGGVAHDFNNMLTVIIGQSDMALARLDPSEPLYPRFQEILKAGERSAELIRQLLAFARKQAITPRALDLNGTLEGMLKMLRRLLGEDIDLVWKPGRGVWPIFADPSQLDQILANLCVNARDAITGVGTIVIETANVAFDDAYCSLHKGFVPGEFVLLAVSDDGCGMDKETLEKIFEPFFTTKELGKGTGLGLATVYGIVKQNDGFINVYSEKEHGTTFRIYLRRHGDESTACESDVGEVVRGGHETILLVEDEAAILEIAQAILESFGYAVLTAGTPGEAIRVAREHGGGIDLLVTDVVMPVMNGRELVEKLRSCYPGLRCLYMSGYTADVISRVGMLSEGIDFIQKPFSAESLASKVREMLDRPSGRRAEPLS